MKAFYLTFIVSLFALAIKAQENKWEVGSVAGISIYQGDLSKKIVSWQFARPASTVFLSHQISKKWSLKGSFTYARLVGNDKTWGEKWSQNGKSGTEIIASGWKYGNDPEDDSYYDRRKRNLSFTSSIQDLAFLAEFRLFNKKFIHSKQTISLYVEGGFSVFHFNPKTIDVGGERVALQSIRTEKDKINADGSLKKYSLFSVSIPMCIEIKYRITDLFSFNVEIQWRKTFTDWIDDVHHEYPGPVIAGDAQAVRLSDRSGEVNMPITHRNNFDRNTFTDRGDPHDKDAFLLMGVGLSYCFPNLKQAKEKL